MYRKSLLGLIAAAAIAISCGDDDANTGGGGGDDGHEHGGNAGESGTSGRGGTSGTGNEGGEPGTGGSGDTGGTGGTRGGTGGTSGTSGESGAGGGGDAVPCESGDPPQCADSDTILVCDPDADDTLQSFTCDEFCSTLGLESGPCEESGGFGTCECGDPIDTECYEGAEEVCACLQGTSIECADDADRFGWYVACLDGDAESEDVVRCFAAGSAQACFRTVEQCVP